MSQTSNNLNNLIRRLEDDLNTQVLRACDAERSLDMLREDMEELRKGLQQEITWATERTERDRYALIEERNRSRA